MTATPTVGSRTNKVVVRITDGLSRRWTHSDINAVRTALAGGATLDAVSEQVGRDTREVTALARQFRMKVPASNAGGEQ